MEETRLPRDVQALIPALINRVQHCSQMELPREASISSHGCLDFRAPIRIIPMPCRGCGSKSGWSRIEEVGAETTTGLRISNLVQEGIFVNNGMRAAHSVSGARAVALQVTFENNSP